MMVPYEHTVRAFDMDMAGMRRAVAQMGRLAEQQFRLAVEAATASDPGRIAQVLADEREVNSLHVRIDELCNRIIALRQPIAVDLREVIGAIHTINDLERIGDEAKKIALRGRTIDTGSIPDLLPRIGDMAVRAADMVKRAVDAFVHHDARAAAELGASDDAVDDLRDALVEALVARMATEPDRVTQLMDLVMVVQSIERVADHAESVAEYVVNVVDGIDMRHGNLPA